MTEVPTPVAYTSSHQLERLAKDPGGNYVMWGEPMPHHGDIPLYTAERFQVVVDAVKASEASLLEALKALSASIFAPADDRSPDLAVAMQMTTDAIAKATGSKA
jgi:hypothetical protein